MIYTDIQISLNVFSKKHCTKNEVFIKDFFSKCDHIRRNLQFAHIYGRNSS